VPRPPQSRGSGTDETRQLEGPLIERRGRLTTEFKMPHADQAVRKFRRKVLPEEQRLLYNTRTPRPEKWKEETEASALTV
jgi:hypothetical protein